MRIALGRVCKLISSREARGAFLARNRFRNRRRFGSSQIEDDFGSCDAAMEDASGFVAERNLQTRPSSVIEKQRSQGQKVQVKRPSVLTIFADLLYNGYIHWITSVCFCNYLLNIEI